MTKVSTSFVDATSFDINHLKAIPTVGASRMATAGQPPVRADSVKPDGIG
jgi:hypothetical protein